EVSIPHVAYACLGGFVVFFGMFSLFIREKLYIGEACWAFLFGVIIGPYGANIFDPRSWGNQSEEITNQITLEFTRVVLAVGVFAIGVELPKAYMRKHWKSLFFLLAPVMTWGWFVSAAFIYALIPRLSFLASLAIAACLTPTDPILAAAVVGGKYADKHVPAHLRHLLAAESGCNDGAAFPFLYISLYLIIDSTTREAVKDWFLILWLYEVIFGVVVGSLIGLGFRYLMKFCEHKDLIDRQSYVAQYVSLALLTIGVTTLIGSDDLLAAFACGTAFAWDGFFNRQTEASVFSSVIDLLFNIAAFVFVGAWTPFNAFSNAELTISVWRLIVIALLVLLFRRLPVMLALYKWIPDVKNWREALFSGHFGPMGIGAVFISTLAMGQLPRVDGTPETDAEMVAAAIQPIVAFMVVVSIVIHGLSIPFFSLGRRVHTMTRTYTGTRTWSRQPSLPDWALQTPHVRRPEDVVINRDPDAAERGALPVQEKIVEEDPAPSMREKTVTTTGSSGASSSGSAGEIKEAEHDAARDAKGETFASALPEDVEEQDVTEWKEGPHKVIERRDADNEVRTCDYLPLRELTPVL
ncbi:Sodium/hydrogen exchanger family-domain-containing protein, partial [Vararia minispora EC-137]